MLRDKSHNIHGKINNLVIEREWLSLITLYFWSVSIFIYLEKGKKREETKKKISFEILPRAVWHVSETCLGKVWGTRLGINIVGETLGWNGKHTGFQAIRSHFNPMHTSKHTYLYMWKHCM